GDKNLPEWILKSLIDDRESRFRSDAIRSLAFVLLSAGTLWAYIQSKLKRSYAYVVLGLLTIIDVWAIDKRYLNNEDFKYNKDFEKKVFSPTAANEVIMQDK